MKKVLSLLSVSAILFLAACDNANTTTEHGANPDAAEKVENTTIEENTTVVNPEPNTTVVDDPAATVTVTTPAGGATVQQ